MNKTYMKVIGIIIIMAIILWGCGNDKDSGWNELDEDKVNIKEVQKGEDIPSLTMEGLQEAYPDKEVLLWVYNNIMTITPTLNHAVNNVLVDRGYDFVLLFKKFGETAYADTIDNMIANGNPPDIICAGIGEAGTLQGTYRAVIKDWLLDITPYLDNEEGKTLKEAYPENMWKAFGVNGRIYGVNGRLPYSTDFAYFVNKDIADKYNIPLESLVGLQHDKLSEVFEIVYQGEKADDFVTYVHDKNYKGYYSTVYDIYNYACYPIVVDNRLSVPEAVNIYEQEDQINYYIALEEYRKKGYLRSDMEEAGEEKREKDEMNATNFFILQGIDDLFGDKGREIIQNIKMDYPMAGEVVVVPYAPGYITKQDNSITGICRHSGKSDTAFRALSAVYTDRELSDLLLYGIEGVDYRLNEGKVVSENNANMWFRSLYFGNSIVSTPAGNEPVNKNEVIFDKISNMMASESLGTYVELSDIAEDIYRINAIVEGYSGLYEGKLSNAEKVIQELNRELSDSNIQFVIDEINKRYLKNK